MSGRLGLRRPEWEPGPRPVLRLLLLILAPLAVVGHLYGLYSPGGPPSPSWFRHVDKVEHLLGFAAPVGLILLARCCSPDRPLRRAPVRFAAVVTGIFALHAVVSELVQHYLYAHRMGDPFDVLADLVGIALGWGVVQLVVPARPAPPAAVAGGEPVRARP